MTTLLITKLVNFCVDAAAREAAIGRYLNGMQATTDLLAEAIARLPNCSLNPEKHHELACRAIVPYLLAEARHLDEDVVMTALGGFCARDLGALLAQHRKDAVACAKVLRANFHRLLRWRQRDAWRRENRRRTAEEQFTVARVRDAYEGSRELVTAAVLAEAATLDPEIAELLPVAAEARSLDELHGRLAGVLHCSKATVRRRLLALGPRLRGLLRRETGRFFADCPASHLPAGTGACAARVIRSVFAAA
jgi:hypothetical protein